MNDLHEGTNVENAMVAESGMVAVLNRSEIDQQITTAKRYPRSVAVFIKKASELVTLDESIARQCIYALPRDGKVIEGASARFAEIVANSWGNCRAGARVVDDSGEFVTSQGVFHDLEANVAITYEVQRRIVDKHGKRYKPDMIGVTANAASSIALRNAILKGVPKAYWESIYQRARKTIAGDYKTLANKRATALQEFQIYGITEVQILSKLGKQGVADITGDDLVLLFGLLTAIRDGDTTPEQAFDIDAKPAGATTATTKEAAKPWAQEEFDAALKKTWAPLIAKGKKTPDEIIAMATSKNAFTPEQIATIKALGKPTDDAPTGFASGEQMQEIIERAGAATITVEEIRKHFKIEHGAAFPAALVPEILAFIADPMGEA